MATELEDLDDDTAVLDLNDDDADADFAAGFNSAQMHAEATTQTKPDDAPAIETDNTPAPPDDSDDNATATAEAEALATAAAAAANDDDAPVTIKQGDFKRLMQMVDQVSTLEQDLRTTKDKAFGRMGSLQQALDSMKKAAPAMSVKQLKRLNAEYPEFADLLLQDLNDNQGETPAATQSDDQPALEDNEPADLADPFADPRVQEALQREQESQRQVHAAVVDAKHPDWRDLVKTTEFAAWRNSLPAQSQELLATSWDSSVLTEAFDHFKAELAKRNASASASTQRDNRLAHAVPATSGRPTGAHVPDADAEFEAGFKSARNR